MSPGLLGNAAQNSLTIWPDHMNVLRQVVVWIDHNS